MKEKIEGYVEHIIFRNEENGYTVLNLTVDGGELTCVGTFQSVNEGEMLEAQGEYTDHAVYGQQFRVESYETKIPQDSMALERYLGSGAIKGVGAALAARIVRRFGEDTLRIIEEEPERLAEIKGISERKAREIAAQMAEKSEMQDAIIFLSQYGISLALGIKIFNQYGDHVYRVLRENPYKITEDIPESVLRLPMKLQHGREFMWIRNFVSEAVYIMSCPRQVPRDISIFRKACCLPERKKCWGFVLMTWTNT